MLLGEWMDENGLSNEDVAARLAEHGVTVKLKTTGELRGVTVDDVSRRRAKVPARTWAKALDYQVSSTPSPGSVGDDGAAPGAEAPSGRRERAPRRPAEAKVVVPEVVGGTTAKRRISGVYKGAGALLANGADSEGVAAVWSDASDPIAELWLEAAKENPWIANIVNLSGKGGATSELALAHAHLGGATLYVLGSTLIPEQIGDGFFFRYKKYRQQRIEAILRARSRNGLNGDAGATEAAPESAVADGQ